MIDAVLGVVRPVFWGLLLLSVLVFVHEGGHFLAARACRVRVTEFFLGLPCRWNLHHVSKRIGTKFGVTPLLLGGYAMICGMEPESGESAARVLGLVHRRGTASVAEIAQELSISEDEALETCVSLMGWGSVAPVYDPAKGEGPNGRYYPTTYAAMPRDAAGNTIYDGRAFDRAHATAEGDSWEPPEGDEAFLRSERSHTYLGKGFWQRAFMLVAGIAVNIVSGFLLLMSIYSIVGINVTVDVNQVGSVEAGSAADAAGLEAGDTILSIDGVPTASWMDVYNAVQAEGADGTLHIEYERDGSPAETDVTLGEGSLLGISAPVATERLSLPDSARMSFAYVAATAQSIGELLNPSHTLQVLDSSTSIVGISVLSAEAASQGADVFLTFAALISFSLGFMNLLPIPPLDGGKLVIEVIQAVIRRPVPLKVQTVLSYIGIALFGFLFIYMLRADVLRFIL